MASASSPSKHYFARHKIAPPPLIIIPHQPLLFQSSSTLFESSSTRLPFHTHQSRCLLRKQPLLRRQRRLLPPQPMPRTKVRICCINCHNSVATIWASFHHVRMHLLTRSCRYDQRGNPHGKLTIPGAIHLIVLFCDTCLAQHTTNSKSRSSTGLELCRKAITDASWYMQLKERNGSR